jgi:hypothetical protein
VTLRQRPRAGHPNARIVKDREHSSPEGLHAAGNVECDQASGKDSRNRAPARLGSIMRPAMRPQVTTLSGTVPVYPGSSTGVRRPGGCAGTVKPGRVDSRSGDHSTRSDARYKGARLRGRVDSCKHAGLLRWKKTSDSGHGQKDARCRRASVLCGPRVWPPRSAIKWWPAQISWPAIQRRWLCSPRRDRKGLPIPAAGPAIHGRNWTVARRLLRAAPASGDYSRNGNRGEDRKRPLTARWFPRQALQLPVVGA